MGEYRFWISFETMIGFLIMLDNGRIILSLPFLQIIFSFNRDAKGFYLFKD